MSSIVVSSTKLTCLVVDTENKTAFIADRGGQIHIYDFIPLRPSFIQIITTPSKCALRGLQVDTKQQLLFASSFDDGFIYGYKLKSNGGKDFNPEKYVTYGGQKSVRHIQWWSSRNELYVGYAGGLMTIYNTNDSSAGPICSMKAHNDDVTGFDLLKDETALVTISKDKYMKFWYPPNNWLKSKENDNPPQKPKPTEVKKTPPAPTKNNPLSQPIKTTAQPVKPKPTGPTPVIKTPVTKTITTKPVTTTTKPVTTTKIVEKQPEIVKEEPKKDDIYYDSESEDDLTGWNN